MEFLYTLLRVRKKENGKERGCEAILTLVFSVKEREEEGGGGEMGRREEWIGIVQRTTGSEATVVGGMWREVDV